MSRAPTPLQTAKSIPLIQRKSLRPSLFQRSKSSRTPRSSGLSPRFETKIAEKQKHLDNVAEAMYEEYQNKAAEASTEGMLELLIKATDIKQKYFTTGKLPRMQDMVRDHKSRIPASLVKSTLKRCKIEASDRNGPMINKAIDHLMSMDDDAKLDVKDIATVVESEKELLNLLRAVDSSAFVAQEGTALQPMMLDFIKYATGRTDQLSKTKTHIGEMFDIALLIILALSLMSIALLLVCIAVAVVGTTYVSESVSLCLSALLFVIIGRVILEHGYNRAHKFANEQLKPLIIPQAETTEEGLFNEPQAPETSMQSESETKVEDSRPPPVQTKDFPFEARQSSDRIQSLSSIKLHEEHLLGTTDTVTRRGTSFRTTALASLEPSSMWLLNPTTGQWKKRIGVKEGMLLKLYRVPQQTPGTKPASPRPQIIDLRQKKIISGADQLNSPFPYVICLAGIKTTHYICFEAAESKEKWLKAFRSNITLTPRRLSSSKLLVK